MAGLLGTGIEYRGRALSGFLRASALEEQREMAEKELKAQGKIQKSKMAGELGAVGALAGGAAATSIFGAGTLLGVGTGAGTGAMLGLPAGPVGMALGAGLGWIFSQLF